CGRIAPRVVGLGAVPGSAGRAGTQKVIDTLATRSLTLSSPRGSASALPSLTSLYRPPAQLGPPAWLRLSCPSGSQPGPALARRSGPACRRRENKAGSLAPDRCCRRTVGYQ